MQIQFASLGRSKETTRKMTHRVIFGMCPTLFAFKVALWLQLTEVLSHSLRLLFDFIADQS